MLLRTLSKFVSLAGVRCGLLVAAPELVEFCASRAAALHLPDAVDRARARGAVEGLVARVRRARRVAEARARAAVGGAARRATGREGLPERRELRDGSDATTARRFARRRADAGILVRTFDDPLLDELRADHRRPARATTTSCCAPSRARSEQSMRKVLFIDRGGTLDRGAQESRGLGGRACRSMPGVIPALLRFKAAGYQFVIVTNQAGLGGPTIRAPRSSAPTNPCSRCSRRRASTSSAISSCPHTPEATARAASPAIGLVRDFVNAAPLDRERSAMVGDRDTDVEFARNLGIRGLQARVAAAPRRWAAIAHALVDRPRVAAVHRTTRETDIRVAVDLDSEAEPRAKTGLGFFDHMLEQLGKHGGFKLDVQCTGDLHIDEHHTVEDVRARRSARRCAKRSATNAASSATASCCRWTKRDAEVSIDLGGRPFLVFEGEFRARPRRRAADRARAALLPFARGDARRRDPRPRARREHAPHGRGVVQRRRARAAPSHRARRATSCRRRRASCEARRRDHRHRAAQISRRCEFALERLGVDALVTTDPSAHPRGDARDPAGRGAAAPR